MLNDFDRKSSIDMHLMNGANATAAAPASSGRDQKKLLFEIGGAHVPRTLIDFQLKGEVEDEVQVLIVGMTIAPLLAGTTQLFAAILTGAVLKIVACIDQKWIVGEVIFAYVSGAHIIQIIGEGNAVCYLKAEVKSGAYPVFEACANGYASGYMAVFAVTVNICVLPFRTERTKEIFFVLIVSVRAVIQCPDACGEVGREAVSRIAGFEAHKIELGLQGKLYNIIAKAQVALLLVGIAAELIVIADLGIGKRCAHRDVWIEVLPYKNATCGPYIFEAVIIVEITEILGAAQADAILAATVEILSICAFGKGKKSNKQKTDTAHNHYKQ